MPAGPLTLAADRVRSAGRYGDTELVHLSPGELEFLRGFGEPTINPETGLPEFFKLSHIFSGLGKALPAIAPLALSIFAPGIGTAIGEALGASGAFAPVLGSTLLSGGLGALTGGAKGALLGAGSGALSSALLPVAENALSGTSLGDALGLRSGAPTVFDALGAGSSGAGAAVPLNGTAPLTAVASEPLGAPSSSLAAIAGGDVPATALPYGGADLTMSGAGYPAGAATDLVPLQSGSGGIQFDSNGDPLSYVPAASGAPVSLSPTVSNAAAEDPWSGGYPVPDVKPTPPEQSFLSKYKTPLLLGGGMLALSGIQGAKATPASSNLALASNTGSSSFGGPPPKVIFDRKYTAPDTAAPYYAFGRVPFSFFQDNSITTAARGGPISGPPSGMSDGSQYVPSSGASGRADDIPAKLSSNEYVMDAETVGLLGDGNPDAGAKKLDQLRQQLRQQKGKALAKGKFSPAAKPAAAYLGGRARG